MVVSGPAATGLDGQRLGCRRAQRRDTLADGGARPRFGRHRHRAGRRLDGKHAGLYRLTLGLGIDGHYSGLWLAHSLYTAPYVLVALAPAYRGYDARYERTAHALGRGHAAFLWRVKWPMLQAPIVAAFAIGFAVSVTQYLSTQFVGAGRFATVTTEALTLAAGGQRTLMAAFALMQALLPALVFLAALALAHRQARRLGAL